MKKKAKYETAILDIAYLDVGDVIATSQPGSTGGNMEGDSWDEV